MEIFVTGDTHIPIDIHKLTMKNWPEQKLLTKDDLLIICGDFGGVWDDSSEEKYWQKWLNDKPFTTCFVCGNHEGFHLLDAMPIQTWNGGNVHRIMPSVIHLMRGQVFTINGVRIFTMGGAESHDKEFRVDGKTWWAREMPSDDEYEEGLSNLDKHNWSVDFVVTHCASDSVQRKINPTFTHNKLTNFLGVVQSDLRYKKWFFGHYHVDTDMGKNVAVYNKIHKIY